jgi:hypothetical protein
MDLDFVDDPDLIGSKSRYHWPENRDRSGDDGNIDFKDGKDVDDGRVIGHVNDWNGPGTVDGQGNHAAKRDCTNAGIRQTRVNVGSRGFDIGNLHAPHCKE